MAHCFTTLALAAPEVHMTLHLNGRLHIQAAAAAGLGERLEMLFGIGFQDQVLAGRLLPPTSQCVAILPKFYFCIVPATPAIFLY